MGRMGWVGERRYDVFFPLLQTYVYICIAGVGVWGSRDWDWVWDHRSFSSIYPIAAACWMPCCKLDWFGLDGLNTMDTPFLVSVSPSSSSLCVFISFFILEFRDRQMERRHLSSLSASSPMSRRRSTPSSPFHRSSNYLLTVHLKTLRLIAYINLSR